jgi:hypothetical protein
MSSLARLSGDERAHNDKDPALTCDHGGRLWVAWQSYIPQVDRILVRGLDGQDAGKLLQVSEEAGVNFQPAIACDADDVIWVVWSAQREGRWQILARSIEDSRLGAVTVLDESDTLACFPAAAADASGRVWAAWSSIHEGRQQIWGRVLSRGRWSPPVVLAAEAGQHWRPVLCGGRGAAWLAYETCLDGRYEPYVRHWTASAVAAPVRFSLTGSWEIHPSLCADGAGGLWAAWVATHDVGDDRGVIDHKVEAMAAHFDGAGWSPYTLPGANQLPGYVTHLYDGLLGRQSYWGFVGHRRRPQLVREAGGDVWLLYERKEDESVNRRGPDALLRAQPLTGPNQGQIYALDDRAYAYAVNSGLPVEGQRLPFAGQIAQGEHYGDICAGYLHLDDAVPASTRPASAWRVWQHISLPEPRWPAERPTIELDGCTYTLYWGDTHCHSTCSGDAEGEIDESYAYGRYRSGLDFMAVTDNDAIYDDTLTTSAWALLRAQAGLHDDPGQFVAFSGYERSYRVPSGDDAGVNHRIVLYPDDAQPIYRFTEADADTLDRFVAQIESTNAFVYPHHARWWLAPNSRLGGVEVCSSWDVYIDAADTIPRALQAGYRLAYIGSSDTHRIVPGLGGALTGVWARALTREGIMEALWARRCYATNGERIVLDVRVNGMPMGAEVSIEGAVAVQCAVHSPRPIRQIELFRDGKRVSRQEPGKQQVSVAFRDRPLPGQHVYHVHVRLEPLPRAPLPKNKGNLQIAHGDDAWSSPIWVHVEGKR